MIVEKNREKLEAVGLPKARRFQIEENEYMFEMLSSGLYTDKIKAVIRELSTNAVDSMIEAGTIETKQFEVELPTSLKPEFSIRDYGTGLTDDGIINLYTTYGSSSKRDSNLFNGAMGVGSKAPFSYTDSFSIVSYKDGVATSYSCYLDSGAPSISSFGSSPTEEENGLLIKIAVKAEDVNKFMEKASQVYHWFSYKPKTNLELNSIEVEEIVSGTGWVLHKREKNSYNSNYVLGNGSKVIMGNICYPIDSSVFNYTDKSRQMSQLPIIIYAEIGEVQMAASREALSMTKETIKWLQDKFSFISKELTSTFQKQLDSETTLWNKYVKMGEFVNSLLGYSSAVDLKFEVVKGEALIKPTRGFNYLDLPNMGAEGYGVTTRIFTARRKRASRHDYLNSISIGSTTKVIVDDVKTGGIKAASEYATANKRDGGPIYLFSRAKGVSLEEFISKIDSLVEDLGNPEIIRTSTLYIPKTRKIIGRVSKPKSVNFEVGVLRGKKVSGADILVDSISSDTIYYTGCSGRDVVAPDNSLPSRYKIESFTRLLRELVGTDTIIYTVNKGNMKYVKGHKKLVNMWDYVLENLSKITCNVYSPEFRGVVINNEVLLSGFSRYLEVEDYFDHPFISLFKKYKEYTKYSVENIDFKAILTESQLKKIKKKKITVNKKEAEVFTKNPLLNVIENSMYLGRGNLEYYLKVQDAYNRKRKG